MGEAFFDGDSYAVSLNDVSASACFDGVRVPTLDSICSGGDCRGVVVLVDGAGAVGGQTLVGVPVVHRLLEKLGPSAAVWPFGTGWREPTPADVEPLSVLAVNKRAAGIYKRGTYGNTMTGNPRAADVGVAVLGMVTQAINRLGGYLRPGMDLSDLDYSRDEEDNPLPSIPAPLEPENPVDAHPEPINPAHDPRPVTTKEH